MIDAGDHDCGLVYEDERGQLYFSGFTDGHESGGMLYFPSAEEWAEWYPRWHGERDVIKSRILEHVRRDPRLSYFEHSLADEGFNSRFPAAVAQLRPPLPPERPRTLWGRIRFAITSCAKFVLVSLLIGTFAMMMLFLRLGDARKSK
jgi:hypothetical protein